MIVRRQSEAEREWVCVYVYVCMFGVHTSYKRTKGTDMNKDESFEIGLDSK